MSQTALKRMLGSFIFKMASISTLPSAPAPSRAMLISSGLPLAALELTIGENAKPAPAAAVVRRKLRLLISLVVS